MKLTTRYQWINLLTTLGIFFCASIAFYLLLHSVLIHQVAQDLEIEQHEVQAYVKRYHTLPPNVIQVEDQMVHYETVNSGQPANVYQDITIYDPTDRATDEFRQLSFTIYVVGQWYKVTISKSLEGTEGLAKDIGLIALGVVLLTLLVSVFINRLVLHRLWKPFYNTLAVVKGFSIGGSQVLKLPQTNTDEFLILNQTLQAAIDKAEKDYKALKEFTENAAHELQTPLAIIHSKMDLLIQDESLSEYQSGLMHETYKAIRRMTYLNRSLLMLAKINNGQFSESEDLDITALLENKLQELDTLAGQRKLKIAAETKPVTLRMNSMLADILLNNLLSNAIDHNFIGGSIFIQLSAAQLSISNTATTSALNSDYLFHRFYKATEGGARTGLGLAIAQEVCNAVGYTIAYSYTHGLHHFTVSWDDK